MSAKVRLIVVGILITSIILELGDLNLKFSWRLVDDWEKVLTSVSVVVALCGAVLAYWAYEDRKKIEELSETILKQSVR